MEASLKYSTILSEGIFTCSEEYLNDDTKMSVLSNQLQHVVQGVCV